MKIEEFTLERIQSLYENTVEYNLSDSGVHPYSLRELLTPEQQQAVLDVELAMAGPTAVSGCGRPSPSCTPAGPPMRSSSPTDRPRRTSCS
jgi:hypothetical protein